MSSSGTRHDPGQTDDRLAIDGGVPCLTQPLVLRHAWPSLAQQLIAELLNDGRLSYFYGGPLSRRFESEFAVAQTQAAGVAVNSGTSALQICYRLHDLAPGDEVVFPAHAYVTALSAALELDAVPILCDVEPDGYSMDPAALGACLSERTRLVVPVHLYGRPADVPRISAVLHQNHCDAAIVEDCGQGHGAELDGRPIGSLSNASAWSFYEIKHVSTGEGGMCLFRSESDAQRARSLCHKGKGTGWWEYREPGFSYPMTELQAAVGLASLQVYGERVALRRAIEDHYVQSLSDCPGLEVPLLRSGRVSGAFKTPIRVARKNAKQLKWFVEACQAENLPVQFGYPAMHRIEWIERRQHRAWAIHPGARGPGDDASLPVATDLHHRTFNIATGPGFDLETARIVTRGIRKVATRGLVQ